MLQRAGRPNDAISKLAKQSRTVVVVVVVRLYEPNTEIVEPSLSPHYMHHVRPSVRPFVRRQAIPRMAPPCRQNLNLIEFPNKFPIGNGSEERREMGDGGPITSRWPVRFFVAKEFGVADRPTDKRGTALHCTVQSFRLGHCACRLTSFHHHFMASGRDVFLFVSGPSLPI